jgi:hypothetical protein
MEQWWNNTDRGKPKNSEEKAVPVPLYVPQIWLCLAQDRTGTLAMGGYNTTMKPEIQNPPHRKHTLLVNP